MKRTGLFLVVLALLLTALPLSSLSAVGATDTVFVRMSSADYDAANVRGVRAVDYGTFVWLELTPAEMARLQASGLAFEAYAEPYTLRLGELSFDTRLGGPELPDGWDAVRGDGPDLHLVQVAGPTQAGWLDSLKASGLQIVQYIHPFTYVVWGDGETLDRVGAAGFVQWTGPFAPAYRVLPRWRNLPDQPVQVSVLLVRVADTDTTVQGLESLGGRLVDRAVLNDIYEIANVILPGARFQEATQLPGVYSIQPEPTDGGLRGEMSNQINVNNHDGSNLAFPGYMDWLAGAGVDGDGVVMANVDGGIEDTHPDLVNRMVGCSGTTCGGSATDDHGTHTAGIMAADGSSGVTDLYGFLRGLGMAPGANLVEQVYWPYYQWSDGMLLLISDSYANGAVLSGNSWGPSGSPEGYDNDTMQVDIGVRDADAITAGNQAFSYVLSIMNGGGGTSTQGTPDEAKNIFTIGSTKMQNSDGSQILAIDDLSSNTAHGPALDGRKIPHMVAPGCRVDSTRTGSSYALYCGTSMASPHVSGAVALFVEYYRNLTGVDPSPALIKAAFLPVAHDLAGHLDADGGVLGHPFDSKQGWGRMDVEAVISPTLPVLYLDDPLVFDNTGEEWVQDVRAADPGQPMRLMLVWTDAPGHGLGGTTPAWNNDLDLVIEVDGDTYLGNSFGADGWSQTGGSADGMNNTEGVFLGPAGPDSLTVRVVASNINSDGIPGQGDDTDQDFALVCYNCVQGGGDFTLDVEPGDLEVCAPGVVTSTIQVGELLTYTHPVTLAVVGVPPGVTAEVSPTVVIPPGEAVLTLDAGVDAHEGMYTLVVSGTGEVTRVHTVALTLSVSLSPEASWESDTPVTLGEAMHFSGTVTGTAPLSYTWDFGGAGLGVGQDTLNPSYTYSESGQFVVSMIVTGVCGTQTATGTVRVDPLEPPHFFIYLPLVQRP